MWWDKWLKPKTKTSAAQQLAADWEVESAKVLKVFEDDKRKLLDLQDTLEATMKKVELDIANANRLQESQQTALEALRNENKIFSDTTIPTLVASHKLILERIDAETAIQARRRVIATTPVDQGD